MEAWRNLKLIKFEIVIGLLFVAWLNLKLIKVGVWRKLKFIKVGILGLLLMVSCRNLKLTKVGVLPLSVEAWRSIKLANIGV